MTPEATAENPGAAGGTEGTVKTGAAAGGGTETKTEGAAAGGATGGADTAGGAESTTNIYKPEGLPDHLIGANDQETIDKINKAYKGAREELGKKGNKAPETADAYTLTLPDDLKGKVIQPGADGKDPVFEALKPALHKAGLSNESAGELATALYKEVAALAAKQQEAAANDPNAPDWDFKALGGVEKAKPLQDASNAWINSLKDKIQLDDKDVFELQLLTQNSQGLKVLNKLRGLTSEKPIPADFGHNNPNKLVTQADIDAMYNDPRYLAMDKEYQKEIDGTIAKKLAQDKAARGR